MYWTASIVEWNISESFCLCILLVSLFFEKEWILICCPLLQSKIGLHKTPQAAQALAPHVDVKGILSSSHSSHSSSIPPEYPLDVCVGGYPSSRHISDFRKEYPALKKKIYLLWHVMLQKNMLHRYMPGKYILSLQVWEKNFTLSKSPIPPLKSLLVDP